MKQLKVGRREIFDWLREYGGKDKGDRGKRKLFDIW